MQRMESLQNTKLLLSSVVLLYLLSFAQCKIIKRSPSSPKLKIISTKPRLLFSEANMVLNQKFWSQIWLLVTSLMFSKEILSQLTAFWLMKWTLKLTNLSMEHKDLLKKNHHLIKLCLSKAKMWLKIIMMTELKLTICFSLAQRSWVEVAKLLSAVLEATLSCLDPEKEKINWWLRSKKQHSKKNWRNHAYKSLNIASLQRFWLLLPRLLTLPSWLCSMTMKTIPFSLHQLSKKLLKFAL